MAQDRDSEGATSDPATKHASLPADRAFVVQIRADVDLASGEIRGRVEHVTSGNAAVFESVEQLVRSMRAVAGGRRSSRPMARRSSQNGDDDPLARAVAAVTIRTRA